MATTTTVAGRIELDGSSIGNVRKQLKEATADLIRMQDQFGETSQEAVKAAKRVAQLKDQIESAREAADLFDPGKKFQAFTTAASQIAAGFSAVQGAMALVGVESEEVEKTLLKVQGALALSQGLSELGDLQKSFTAFNTIIQSSTILQKANAVATSLTSGAMRMLGISVNTTSTSFKVLRTAIISTGIGALVVAIGFAVEALMNLADSTEDAEDASKKFEEQEKKTEDAIKAKTQALNDTIAAMDAVTQTAIKRARLEGASEEQITNIQRKALQDKIDIRKRDLDSIDTSNSEFFNKTKAYGQALAELENFELDQRLKRQDEGNKKLEQRREKAIEDRKKKDEEQKKIREAADKVLDEARRAKLTEQQKAEEDVIRQFEENKKALQLAGIKDFTSIEEQRELALKAVRDKYRIEQEEKDKESKDKQLQKDLEHAARLEKIRVNTLNAQREFNDAMLRLEAELQNKRFDLAQAGLDLIGSLAGQNEKLANVMFAVQRGLEIARIVTETARGIVSAKAGLALVPPFIGTIPNPAFLKAAAITAKQIASLKISAATSIATITAASIRKFMGGGSPNLGGAAAFSSGISTNAPLAANLSPQTQLQLQNRDAINNLGNQATRAYILNSDLQNNNQINAYLLRNATIG